MEKQLIITLILSLSAVVGNAMAPEGIDSLSYAYGHQYTLATMAGKNELMQSDEDFRDYIRGLEDVGRNRIQMNDSSYMVSYILGAMEAVFMTDGMHHKRKEDLPPFSCIIAGLRKVGDGNVSIPSDTIAAIDLINRYSKGVNRPVDLDEDEKCSFFTAYGIMKAYQPGLREYAEELKHGTSYKENRQAYATGMADILEAYTEAPKSAYDMGRMVSLSMTLTAIEDSPIDIDYRSFVAGAKASLGLGQQIIPRDEVEEIFTRQFEIQSDATDGIDYAANFEKVMEITDRLRIEPFNQYQVNWKVTAAPVAGFATPPTGIFENLVSELNISDSVLSGMLMAQAPDADSRIYETASVAIGKYTLPDGFKWFCGRNDDALTTIGIMNTESVFAADVDTASVDIDTASCIVSVQWDFNADDAIKWAKFTEACIGRHVAVEIDGRFMFAPRVNQQITGGRCAVAGLTSDEINLLFGDAEKGVGQESVDTIEIIEMD
ncbi:MAG: hypothetical protein K2O78_09565 [Muribaculaceae bacterium]|nr:hypothetical protein [Muribaculaceae bacterium]